MSSPHYKNTSNKKQYLKNKDKNVYCKKKIEDVTNMNVKAK